MSKTLFRYIFLDLFKVFLMASGALAGIMSFGGLLRPLTDHGLDGGQIFRILSDLMPAMSTYSLPIAALFATTVVYGRLAADNELTACRASGISHLAVAMPGLLLGLMVAILSLVLLCFVVPLMTLDVEKTIYSNLAKIIATKIERTHQYDNFGQFTVFAQSATLAPTDIHHPEEQAVVLTGPMIVRYTKADPKKNIPRLPREFWMARQATLHIRPNRNNPQEVLMEAVLEGGTKFPREFAGGVQAGIEATQFGPIPLQSGLREKPKFMNIFQLKEMDSDPTRSLKVKQIVEDFIREEQVNATSGKILAALNSPSQTATFNAADAVYTIKRGKQAPSIENGMIRLASDRELEDHPLRLEQVRGDRTVLSVLAREMTLTLRADTERERVVVSAELFDCTLDTGSSVVPRASLPMTFSTPMDQELLSLENRTVAEYLSDKSHSEVQHKRLVLALVELTNRIRSEMHARASFSISCLILVMIGTALGMMFRSGNFLNAFAVSVVPAMVTIVLIVTGQHIAESVPEGIASLADPLMAALNPLQTGLYVIWSGNIAVLVIATILLWRLHRQ